jgi:quercetin dioxygenase-like cupin family protein
MENVVIKKGRNAKSSLASNSLTSVVMDNAEFGKSTTFVIGDTLGYVSNSVVIKTIIRKTTGHVSAVSCDAGEILSEKVSPFDTFLHVLDGKAEIVIDDESNTVETGQSIIIPAHARNTIKANVRFKMLSTIIKSGYEELI